MTMKLSWIHVTIALSLVAAATTASAAADPVPPSEASGKEDLDNGVDTGATWQNKQREGNPADCDSNSAAAHSSIPSVMTERFLVAGATGSVGRRIVHYAAKDPRVSAVTAVVRGEEKPAEFYGLAEDPEAAAKVSHFKMDYANVNSTEFPEHTVGASGLGVYTQDVSGQEQFFEREHGPNLGVAKAAAQAGVTRWAYLSGMGVYVSESKAWHQPMFSFVKGRVESDLATDVPGFTAVTTARPGGIFGRGVDTMFENMMNSRALSWLQHTSMGVHTNDIAKSMVKSVLDGNRDVEGLPAPSGLLHVLENNDIRKVATKYNENLEEYN